MAILFIVHKQMHAYRENKIDRAEMFRNIYFEVLGQLLAIALAVVLVQIMVGVIPLLVGEGFLGMGIAIASSLLIGLDAMWIVKATWGRLTTK